MRRFPCTQHKISLLNFSKKMVGLHEDRNNHLVQDKCFLGDQYYFEERSEVEIDVVKQDNTSWSVKVQTPKITFNQRDLR